MAKIVYECPRCEAKGKPKEANKHFIDMAKSVGICGDLTDKCSGCGADLFTIGLDMYFVTADNTLEKISPDR